MFNKIIFIHQTQTNLTKVYALQNYIHQPDASKQQKQNSMFYMIIFIHQTQSAQTKIYVFQNYIDPPDANNLNQNRCFTKLYSSTRCKQLKLTSICFFLK